MQETNAKSNVDSNAKDLYRRLMQRTDAEYNANV